LVGSADSWRQMMEPATLANGLVSVYSLGLFHHLYRGVKVVMHGGSVIGGNSQMLTVPAHGLDIAIMVNGAPASAAALANQVIDIVIGDKVLGASDVIASTHGFEHLLGARYHGPSGMLVGFGDVGGKLGVSILNNVFLPLLVDRGDDLYVGFEHVALGPYIMRKADIAPSADGGPPEALLFGESGTVERLKRLPATQPDCSKTGRALVGHYRSHDLAAEAEVVVEDGSLQLQMRGDYAAGRSFKLEAFSKQAFGFSGGAAAGSRYALTVERKASRVTGFRIDSIRARHLLFQRVESSA
jgi:D-aminopeptidase